MLNSALLSCLEIFKIFIESTYFNNIFGLLEISMECDLLSAVKFVFLHLHISTLCLLYLFLILFL